MIWASPWIENWLRPFQLGNCFADLSGSSHFRVIVLLPARKEILASLRLNVEDFESPHSWGSKYRNRMPPFLSDLRLTWN